LQSESYPHKRTKPQYLFVTSKGSVSEEDEEKVKDISIKSIEVFERRTYSRWGIPKVALERWFLDAVKMP